MRNAVTTVAPNPAAAARLVAVAAVAEDAAAAPARGCRRITTRSRSEIVVRGQVALGDSAGVTIPQHDPDAAYVAALTEALRERGITVGGQSGTPESEHADSLFTMMSVPLREILPAILKPSQNQIAEVFLRTIGLERTGIGTADSGRRVVERQFTEWKIPSDGYVVRDGSGLSRNDLISPEAVVGILDVMRRSPNFDLFFQSLPIAGVDGTIRTRMKGTPAEGNLHAKTGTLSMVRSLSGYVTIGGRSPVGVQHSLQ